MEDIRVDEDGVFRCWNCGGRNFTEKRTGRAKVFGGTAGVLTFGVAGAAVPLLAKKRLRCQSCNKYSATGNAKPWTGLTLTPKPSAKTNVTKKKKDATQGPPPPPGRRTGWYRDPLKQSKQRWWSGTEWTTRTSD